MSGRNLGEPPRAPTLDLLRLVFAVVGLVAVLCGYIGFGEHLNQPPPPERDEPYDSWDLLYYTLQLFVLGSPPLDDGGPFPPPLNVARFAAPAVTVYALAEAARLLFQAELRRLRARLVHNHVIVCGDGMVANTLARRLRGTGHRVVSVPSGAMAGESGESGARRVARAARDPDVLQAAGVGRARALYACTDDSAANTAIALAAARHGRYGHHRPLAVYAQVADPELCLALQARHLGLSGQPGARVQFFNIEELAARKLFSQLPIHPVGGAPPRVVLLGATTFGRAVLVELARRWRARVPDGRAVPVALVDPAAPEAASDLVGRYPLVGRHCRISPYRDLAELVTSGDFPLPPHRVFICCDDEQQALKTALTAEALWPGRPGSVVVRLDRLASLRDAFGTPGDRLLDDLPGSLRPHGVVHEACDPDLIGDDLARVIHECYVAARRRRGGAAEDDPALVPWERLPETLRRSNRAQAEDIGAKLAELGCALSPRTDPGDEYVLVEPEIDRLAVLEHQRWVAERAACGWRYGAHRDDVRRLHPAMASWDCLDEEMRVRNHDAIRELPVILADAGFRIVRVRPSTP